MTIIIIANIHCVLCARHLSKPLTNDTCKVGTIIIPISQMKLLRHRKIKLPKITQISGHTISI